MKIQDILFFVVLIFLIFKRDPRLTAGVGLACFLLAMPLFYLWIFFTAERLTWYGAGFILLSVIFNLLILRKNHE